MHLPANIGDFTDFFSSIYHASSGWQRRGAPSRDDALFPNWSVTMVTGRVYHTYRVVKVLVLIYSLNLLVPEVESYLEGFMCEITCAKFV